MLLQAFTRVRSERLLIEQLGYKLLFRSFVGRTGVGCQRLLQERDRLLEGDIERRFIAGVLTLPQVRKLLSYEHLSVDGTLIEAWASMKSVQPEDGGCRPRLP